MGEGRKAWTGSSARSHAPMALAAMLPAAGAFVATVGGVFGGLDSSFGDPIAAIASAVLVALTIAVTRPPARVWRALAPVFGVLAIAAGWAGATSLGAFGAPALVPDLLLPEMLGLAAAGGMLLAGCLIGWDRGTARAVEPVVLIAAAIALLGMVAYHAGLTLSDTLWQPGQQGRFAGTFGNANVAGTFYAAAAVLGIGRLMERTDDGRAAATTALWSVACAILLAACLLTASRTAAASVAAAGSILMVRRFGSGQTRRDALLLGAAALVGVALVALLTSDFLVVRSDSIDQDWTMRRRMWGHYTSIAAQSPWLGYGLGSFQTVNLANLQTPELAVRLWPINAAHNVLIELTIDAGLPFALLISGAVSAILVRALVAVVRRAAPGLLPVLLAVGVVIVNAMVDIALNVPATVLLFWFLLGLLWIGSSGVRSSRRPSATRASAA